MHTRKSLGECFDRIRNENDELNAFVTVRWEEALKEIEHAATLPLEGLLIAVEDSIQVKGYPTTYGSLLLTDNLASEDDLEITRLKEGGGIVIGKTNVSEFGFSPYTQNRVIPPTLNPITKEICLGSSGGAAVAVSAGLADLGIGTDITGGVRLPAYDCKLFAIKPTRGRIPICRPHIIASTEKLLHQKGLIARDPLTLATSLQVLGKPEAHDLDCCCIEPINYFDELKNESPVSLKIGFVSDLGGHFVDPKNDEAFKKKIENLRSAGHTLVEVKSLFSREMLDHCKNILASDRYLPLLSLKERDKEFMKNLDSITCRWFCEAKEVSGIDYSAALFYMQWVREEIEGILEKVDLLLTPCLPSQPLDILLGPWAFLVPFNLSGHPAMVLPSGVQAVGKYYNESLLLRFSMDEKIDT